MRHLSVIVIIMLLFRTAFAQSYIAPGRIPLAALPTQTADVKRSIISLNGEWEINTTSGADAWKDVVPGTAWKKIQVPGEPAMQGFGITNDKEFFYRTTVRIPDDAKDKTVLIHFNGVYSYARLFVNGQFIRDHTGGFTAWDCDITRFAKPGETIVLHVGVTDRADDISYASGYAHHPIGGILREVQLLVLPKEYVNRFYVDTKLSADFKKAVLHITLAKNQNKRGGNIRLQVIAPDGKKVTEKTVPLPGSDAATTEITIEEPVLWNEESPNLYTLQAELMSKNKLQQTIRQHIGIRNIQVKGKQVLVNGDPIKLRGACRHDMHPTLGRSTNRYYDSLDVVLAKEANLNFIRTSHYPPSQDFLEFADKAGLYVQEETAICFANDWRVGVYYKHGNTSNDTTYTSRYLGQLSEMIDRDRNHASVIMWSIGNESTYGVNFQKEYEFVKSVDSSRPVSWSFPGTAIKQNKQCFDIAVAHYPLYNGTDTENFGLPYKDMEHATLPLLSDEWAHIACYNVTMLKLDPNVKDFWGHSLDSMWTARFDVPGNLGGAIWAMTDETFHLPDSVTGYGPWGFIDVWRRPKVEFWNTRKAHSPVKVLKTEFDASAVKDVLMIPVKNRFNHQSLNEVRATATLGGRTVDVKLPPLKPHEVGEIAVKTGDAKGPLLLHFYDRYNRLLDEELITWDRQEEIVPLAVQNKWDIQQRGEWLELRTNIITIKLDKRTGQLRDASVKGEPVLRDAIRVVVNKPKQHDAFKETTGVFSGDFKVSSATINTTDKSQVTVTSQGWVDQYPVKMTTHYRANGVVECVYEADSIPAHTWQIGLAFPLTPVFETIEWKRKGYWTTYPQGHLSATEGVAVKQTNIQEKYRVRPTYDVANAMHDYYLTKSTTTDKSFLQGSEIFRATKENIFSMDVISPKNRLRVIAQGQQASKINVLSTNDLELLVLDKWDYWSLAWGNFAGTPNRSRRVKGKAVINLVQEK